MRYRTTSTRNDYLRLSDVRRSCLSSGWRLRHDARRGVVPRGRFPWEPRTFDDAIQELLRLVCTPVPRLADMHCIPQLPPHYLPRADLAELLEALVLGDVAGSAREVPPRVLRASVAWRCSCSCAGSGDPRRSVDRHLLGDGVVWLRLGRDPNRAVLLQELAARLVIRTRICTRTSGPQWTASPDSFGTLCSHRCRRCLAAG